ncbi:putative redox protein fmp46, mitochondrial [Lachnellula willkommii]|uniref:Putative redox protein fmp46, mitochondrial n=1 Tax=Lachnellula willkommii TaxID=215461 RepID=A0A559LZS6_9HELO|nr:putative redox protein fmp46, mitochondrial [Lachnellula willkommii]
MFRFQKTLDVITLFHKASSPASLRVHTLLKQASATASSTATEDQASDHSAQSHPARTEFELNITEEPPTEDQLKNILEYIGAGKIGRVVKAATSEADALKKFRLSKESFQWPVTVDWENGKAVQGDNESEILKLVQALPEKK